MPDLDAIFCEAIELRSPEERDAFVSRACAGDDTLRQEVESLVAAHFRANSFLEQPPVPAVTAAWVEPDAPGTFIGPYKLLEQIGEGGMGVVFVAEQTHPIRRRVALKLIKPGMDTREVVARFEAERQALALMDHQNIARILDGGTTEQGRPYFVMELVRGLPITEYCDRAALSPRDRLALFVQVCRAVQHAHMRGVIHRDLKPGNVLVTLHDGTPVPKVIDFGVAKALGQSLTERTLYTRFAQMVGTPLYMAPEQAELSGLDVDTRADVYSLGVLLYELLTGTTPFDAETLRRAGLDEVRRMIREDEPPRPSQRLSTLRNADCGTRNPASIPHSAFRIPQLQELDWVVMRCLEKDRNRRYDSAGALAADVERYLADEPVEACPPSAGYRARKFWRRNRRALVPAGVVAATLVAATAVSTWLAIKAVNAERRADERADSEKRAREEAAREAAVAKAVSDFLQTDLLKLADKQVQTEFGFVANPNLTVREALHRAAATVEQRFRDQPLVEAEIRATIGQAYIGVGEVELGETHLARALALFEAHREPHHPQVLAVLDSLAHVYGWMTNQWPRAIALRERAVAAATAGLGPDHPTTLEAISELGGAYVSGGQHSDGIRLLELVLAKRRESLGPDHPLTELAVVNLADRLRQSGRWQESVALLEPLVEKARATLGPDHRTTVDRTDLLARSYEHVGRVDEALAMLQKVVDFRRTTLGPEDGDTIHSMILLSRAYWTAGQPDNADGLLREAVRITRTYEGVHGAARLAVWQMHLAHNLLLQRRYAEAEAVAREALTALDKHRPNHWARFCTASLVGGALLGKGAHAAAEPFLVQGYEGLRQREATIYRPQLGRLREAGERLARLYDETGRPDKARAVRDNLPRFP